MASANACPIWQTDIVDRSAVRFDGEEVNSPRAGGWYRISRSAIYSVNRLEDREKAKLTTWLVEQRNLGNERPEVSSYVVDDVSKLRLLTIPDRCDRFLTYLTKNSPTIGASIEYIPFFEPLNEQTLAMLAWSESCDRSELGFLLDFMTSVGWVSVSNISTPDLVEIIVAVSGYARLAEISAKQIDSSQAFVAMWFAPSLDEAFLKGFEPGIRDAGYKPLRIDRLDHNNKIDDEIISEIRRSRFVVADFTQDDRNGARGGVYYEAGFAHGLNIPVIFTCREDAIGKVHFDTRQYNHITWDDPADLREKLQKRISATIGDGPLRK